MNGINRRGQKVVCVAEIEVGLMDGTTYQNVPKMDGVYTVSDFVDNTGMIVMIEAGGSDDLTPGITLIEIQHPLQKSTGRPLGWPIVCFRPVDERKTDISDLVRQPTYDEMREIIRETHRQAVDA